MTRIEWANCLALNVFCLNGVCWNSVSTVFCAIDMRCKSLSHEISLFPWFNLIIVLNVYQSIARFLFNKSSLIINILKIDFIHTKGINKFLNEIFDIGLKNGCQIGLASELWLYFWHQLSPDNWFGAHTWLKPWFLFYMWLWLCRALNLNLLAVTIVLSQSLLFFCTTCLTQSLTP